MLDGLSGENENLPDSGMLGEFCFVGISYVYSSGKYYDSDNNSLTLKGYEVTKIFNKGSDLLVHVDSPKLLYLPITINSSGKVRYASSLLRVSDYFSGKIGMCIEDSIDGEQGLPPKIDSFFDRLAFPEIKDENPGVTEQVTVACSFFERNGFISEDIILSIIPAELVSKIGVISDYLPEEGKDQNFVSKIGEYGSVNLSFYRGRVHHNQHNICLSMDELDTLNEIEDKLIKELNSRLEFIKNKPDRNRFTDVVKFYIDGDNIYIPEASDQRRNNECVFTAKLMEGFDKEFHS